jgi:UDPglucose 6-dehydrogenase
MEINATSAGSIVHKVRELLGTLTASVSGCWAWRSSPIPTTCAMRRHRGRHMFQREGGRCAGTTQSRCRCGERYAERDHVRRIPTIWQGCDALVLMTEWNEFKHLDLARLRGLMRTPVIVDGRNVYEPQPMWEAGFLYRGVGRGYNHDRTE